MFLTSSDAEGKRQECETLQCSERDQCQTAPCLAMDSLYISNSNLAYKKKSKLMSSKLPSKGPLPLKPNNSSSYRTPIKYRKCFTKPSTPTIPLTISPIKMPQGESLKVNLLMNTEQNLSLKSPEQFLLRIPLEVESLKSQHINSTKRGMSISRHPSRSSRRTFKQQGIELRNNTNTHHIVLKPRLRRYLTNNVLENDVDLESRGKNHSKLYSTPKNSSVSCFECRHYSISKENNFDEEKKCDSNQYFKASDSLDLSIQFTTPSRRQRSQTNIPSFYTPLSTNSSKLNQTPSRKSPSSSKSQDFQSPIMRSSSYTSKRDSRHLMLPVLAIP